jgi:hypothetical protein
MLKAWAKTKHYDGKVTYFSFIIAQLCPVASSSLVLPFRLPPSPTVVAVVLVANALL